MLVVVFLIVAFSQMLQSGKLRRQERRDNRDGRTADAQD
jgi:hypothetical protein